MTAPLNLQSRFRDVNSNHESSLERMARRVAWVVIFLCAIVIGTMVFKAAPPATIRREITPAERKQVAYLEDKFKLHGYMWMLDRTAGEISYWRKGKWRVIKL